MEQELLKKLEKSAEAFDDARQNLSSMKTQVEGLSTKVKALEEKSPEIKEIKEFKELNETVRVLKDAADKNQPALDKLIAKSNEVRMNSEASTMTYEQYFNDQLAIGLKENGDAVAKFARKETKSFAFQMKTVGDMAFSTNFSSAVVSTAQLRPGIIPSPYRKVHLRELFPQGPMTGSAFYYVKEVARGEGTIGTVAEGNTKAQRDFDLTEASATAQYIAGYTRINKKMLSDVQGLTTFLQSRLIEELLRAEDTQLLSGDGTGSNISGIVGGSNYTAYSGSSAKDVEEIIGGISQLEDSLERDANGILIRPATYYDIIRSKASGSGEYNLPFPGVNWIGDQLSIAGVRASRSTAMTSGKFLVGDFQLGALLLMREPPVVEFFEQDQDNVIKNKITVRVEERIAFPIFGTDYFVYGDLSGS